jgi:hypothetical protein
VKKQNKMMKNLQEAKDQEISCRNSQKRIVQIVKKKKYKKVAALGK